MPSPQDYVDRREEYVAWLEANNINPRHVLRDADVTIEDRPTGRVLRCEVCALTPDGHKQVDERGKRVATEFAEVPLLVQPPEWWEPYEKPTRNELLELVADLRKLGPDLEREATAPGMDEAAREAKRDASRRLREILGRIPA
jgi:hypothetical protein